VTSLQHIISAIAGVRRSKMVALAEQYLKAVKGAAQSLLETLTPGTVLWPVSAAPAPRRVSGAAAAKKEAAAAGGRPPPPPPTPRRTPGFRIVLQGGHFNGRV